MLRFSTINTARVQVMHTAVPSWGLASTDTWTVPDWQSGVERKVWTPGQTFSPSLDWKGVPVFHTLTNLEHLTTLLMQRQKWHICVPE